MHANNHFTALAPASAQRRENVRHRRPRARTAPGGLRRGSAGASPCWRRSCRRTGFRSKNASTSASAQGRRTPHMFRRSPAATTIASVSGVKMDESVQLETTCPMSNGSLGHECGLLNSLGIRVRPVHDHDGRERERACEERQRVASCGRGRNTMTERRRGDHHIRDLRRGRDAERTARQRQAASASAAARAVAPRPSSRAASRAARRRDAIRRRRPTGCSPTRRGPRSARRGTATASRTPPPAARPSAARSRCGRDTRRRRP